MSPALIRRAPLAVGAAGLLAWAVLLLVAPASALQGWLIAFVFWAAFPLGALGVVLIHRLTGGDWGEAFAPELEPAAATTPWLLLFVLPVLFGLPLIYPWAAHPARLDEGVRSLFLNPPLFVTRTAIGLIGWAAIARALPRIEGPRGRLRAGLALGFHVIAGCVLAVDWVLSVTPQYTSSAFGMSFVISQFAVALAWAGLEERERAARSPAGDLGQLLFASVLALSYLGFMSYIVVWYADRPHPGEWYRLRIHGGWGWMPAAVIGIGFLATSLLLALRPRLGVRRSLQAASVTALTGVLLYDVWLLAPAFGVGCLGPAFCALIGLGGVWIVAAGGVPRLGAQVEALAHGR